MNVFILLSALKTIGEIAERIKEISADIKPVVSLIKEIEDRAGKKLGDMDNLELAELLSHETKTPDDLIGKIKKFKKADVD